MPLSVPSSWGGPGPSSQEAANVRPSLAVPEKQSAAAGVTDGFAPAAAAKTSHAPPSLPTPSVLAQPQPPSGAVRPTDAEPPSSAAPASAFSTSAKCNATQRKVAKLLDITTSSEIKDLASYVDNILPGYFYSLGDSEKDESSSAEVAAANGHRSTPAPSSAASSHSNNNKTITSTALRSALDHRTIDVHKSFLQEFTAVYQSYQRVAAQVNELQSKCSSLEDTLNTTAGRPSREVEDFFYQIQAYQAELQLVRSHDKEVDEFRKQHHFGAAEQQVLEEGAVDMNFLNVLERARQVHQRSSELMQSQEYHQGALAVMESTYGAITRATEKIARHLLSTAGSGEGRSAGVAASAAAGGAGSIAADVPEVTGFQLRCVRLLYEESPSLHEKFLDEVARLRRASVLRRYFHLLTTGSANTSTGLYQSGGQPSAYDGGVGSRHGSSEAGMGARPLEAELNNPTYFFSSLCAWLHQTIAEEQDFIHNFFVSDEPEVGQGGRRSHATTAAPSSACLQAGSDAARAARDKARQQALLEGVFGGVCKHIRAALDNVLERLGRTAAVLGAATCSSEGEGRASGCGSIALSGSADALAPRKGPRGLTGGLTRLFMAATGRSPIAAFRGAGHDESNALLQRYAGVTTRAQQEAVASSMLRPPLQGIQTCVTLVQLFEYYTATTFAPLLGEDSALTRLIRKTAPQKTRELFQRLLHVLTAHLLDSTAGIIGRTATLRRLASSHALKQAADGDDAQGVSPLAAERRAVTKTGPSTFVLDFLVTFTYGNDANSLGGAPNGSESALLNDSESDIYMSFSSLSAAAATTRFRQANDGQLLHHSAHDLRRVLSQLILPPSPEVAAYCAVVHSVLQDTARQVELLGAIAEQQRAAVAQGHRSSGPAAASDAGVAALATHTEVTFFVQEMLQSLLKAARSVEADGPLRTNLDDPCRAIVEYNVLYQLRDVLEQHAAVLGVLFKGSDAQGQEAERTLDSIRMECSTTMTALRQRLVSAWTTAVELFYFPVSTEAVVAAMSSAAAAEANEKRLITVKKDVRRVLKQFVNVYNTIASLGHLPEPVPLLLALAGGDDVCEEVRRKVTLSIVEDVYTAEFKMLSYLPPTEELVAVQTEMAPQNLLKLVDFSSSAPAATSQPLSS
ncbi:conserved hypothetical protein [Leishmania infantum JPCM5]|uniref:Conserved oligomeric Golgi complex subunit 6 n=2 Tax=Leishmania infantum TaxID=5671 RepID=A0A6L0XNT9_LEIIN|nr:conserved hypothetical protein [Leishmania infantum JPCM5]CAC9536127.1 Conserved_oligomeric_complex_COG6_-_putative [Leishmania infantum]CAM71510.1 conserved hypothetical protein [Leishmania infantum JPCM5]SUZ45399.1 Conserved_oligomeric_complex_COG6_-_putative [Leishmania infantum]|eukprot:XP_001468426.1 conserved hypothetical protein [Leishmania infantum JPCM5]